MKAAVLAILLITASAQTAAAEITVPVCPPDWIPAVLRAPFIRFACDIDASDLPSSNDPVGDRFLQYPGDELPDLEGEEHERPGRLTWFSEETATAARLPAYRERHLKD